MTPGLLPRNILMNAVAPDAIVVPMNQMCDADIHKVNMPDIPAGPPDDTYKIASRVAWLCSSEQATCSSGQ